MMLMKKNLPSIFKSKDSTTKSPWELWPSCKNPKTLSFRAGDHVFKTVNSIFFDPISDGIETPDSLFTNSSESSYSTESEIDGKSLEILVRGARSERLFFELEDTRSILEKSKMNNNNNSNKKELLGYKESLVISMESENPYEDFRKSMEEMVESHGVKDWEGLEELLGWYLKMNWRKNHEFIVGAFVDLLVDILISSSSSFSQDSNYYTCVEESSSSSSSDSSSLSLIHRSMKKEIDEEEEDEQIRVKL